jgi:hypothetical protein
MLIVLMTPMAIISLLSNEALALSSGDGAENIVITLNTDPTKDPEPACVALQIGMNLLMTDLDGDGFDDVVAANSVTLFVTTGGVELINPDNSIYNRNKPKSVCTTPFGVNTASLQELLQGFAEIENADIVICPLCASSRGIEYPVAGHMGTSIEIHDLFLDADKVITF